MTMLDTCPEGITTETLSAWRDAGLSADEAARLAAHAPGCPACQARLGALRGVGSLLAAQRIPTAAPVDVAAVRAGRPGARAGRPLRRVPRVPRAVWGGIGAVAAVALVVFAFTQVFARLGHPTPTATATPATTATVTHSNTLVWSQRTIPPGLTLDGGQLDLAFSPANDQVGWLCQPDGNGGFTIWRTTDQARTWNVVGTLTQTVTSQPVFSCSISPDPSNVHTLVLSFATGCGECGTASGGSYISADNGASWTAPPGALALGTPVTVGGVTYVIASDPTGKDPRQTLFASSGGLSVWQSVGPPDLQSVYYLMPGAPSSKSLLLVETQNRPSLVWRTDDGGATWTSFTLSQPIVVTQSLSGWDPTRGSWRICGWATLGDPAATPIECTTDLGATWSATSIPDPPKGCDGVMEATPTGAVYATCEPPTFSPPAAPLPEMYVLLPGASAWVPAGSPPITVAHPYPPPATGGSAPQAALIFAIGASGESDTLWYCDPSAGVLAVAQLG